MTRLVFASRHSLLLVNEESPHNPTGYKNQSIDDQTEPNEIADLEIYEITQDSNYYCPKLNSNKDLGYIDSHI
jgi:hypothetical protein